MNVCVARSATLLLVVVVAAVLPAQDVEENGAETKILALEHVWDRAQAGGDLKALDALFDSELIYIGSDGSRIDKGGFLSQVKSSPLHQVVRELTKVQVFEDTAIVNGTYQSKEFNNGRALLQRGRFTDTWINKSSTWVCIAAQSTPILRSATN
jgi:hypothetical protein